MRFTNPFVLLISSLSLLGGFLIVRPIFEDRHAKANQAKLAYESALFDTETQLSSLMRGVTENGVLLQNMSWGLEHSVGKALEASLRSGELDELILVDANCQTLAKASAKSSLIKNCPLGDLSVKKIEQFMWTQTDKGASVGLVLPVTIENRSDIFLAGYVHLNETWLELHPRLEAMMAPLSLKILSEAQSKEEAAKILVKEGADPKGKAIASLATQDFLLKSLPKLSHHAPMKNSPFAWYCLLVACGFAISAWAQSIVKRKQAAKEKEQHYDGVCSMLKRFDPDSTITSESFVGLPSVVEATAATFEKQLEKLRTARKELQALREEIKDREYDLIHKSQKIDDMAAYESLASQLSESSKSFYENISAMQSQAEDIADIMTHGVNRNAQILSGQMETWNNEIKERGSRRFFRALSETPGRNQENFLDEQVQTFYKVSQELASQAINASMHAQRLTEGLRESVKLTKHWQGLTLTDVEENECQSLLDALLESQKLLRSKEPDAKVAFLNPFGLNGRESLPALPKSILVSAFYHMYAVLVSLAKGQNLEEYSIQNQLKHSDKRFSFVLSLDGCASAGEAAKLDPVQQQNLDIAARLLAGYNIKCHKLPGFNGSCYLALSWERSLVTHRESAVSL